MQENGDICVDARPRRLVQPAAWISFSFPRLRLGWRSLLECASWAEKTNSLLGRQLRGERIYRGVPAVTGEKFTNARVICAGVLFMSHLSLSVRPPSLQFVSLHFGRRSEKDACPVHVSLLLFLLFLSASFRPVPLS